MNKTVTIQTKKPFDEFDLLANSEGVDSTVSSEFTEIARVLKDDMDFDDVSEMGEMLRELRSASDSVGTLARTSTSSSGNQSVQVELSLDAAATEALLNGQAVTATGQIV